MLSSGRSTAYGLLEVLQLVLTRKQMPQAFHMYILRHNVRYCLDPFSCCGLPQSFVGVFSKSAVEHQIAGNMHCGNADGGTPRVYVPNSDPEDPISTLLSTLGFIHMYLLIIKESTLANIRSTPAVS